MLFRTETRLLLSGPFAMKVFSSSYINVILLVILFVTGNDSAPNKKSVRVDNDAREKFGKLLTTIANMNEKKLNVIKEYTELDSYKAGNGILRKVKNRNSEKKIFLTEDISKAIIYEKLHEVICKGGILPDLVKYKDEMLRAEIKNGRLNEILFLNDKNTMGLINEILHEMICKKGIILEIPQSKSPATAWLRHKNHLMADYYDDKFDQIDNSEPLNYIRNKYSSETINKYSSIDDSFNREDDNSDDENESDRNDVIIDEADDRDDDFEYDDDIDQNDKHLGDDVNIYKKVLRSSCWKSARKNCKKACERALKDVCDDYMCSKRMKKAFKKKCQSYCKDDY